MAPAESGCSRLAADVEGFAFPFQTIETGSGIGSGLGAAIQCVPCGEGAAIFQPGILRGGEQWDAKQDGCEERVHDF